MTNVLNRYMGLPLFAWAVVVAVAFAGCAKPNVWTKSGMNQERFDQDFAKCQREASLSTQTLHLDGDTGLERSFMQENIVKKCMYAKGMNSNRKQICTASTPNDEESIINLKLNLQRT